MLPRPIIPGSTYLVTRRCSQRQFWLKPSRLTNQIVHYCLAYAAERTEMEIHAVCVMSNHHHLVVTDPHGRLPAFTALFHKLVAKCINAMYGHWENMWAGGEQASYVRLLDDDAIRDKMVYTLTNPVAAGLVERRRDFPGLLLETPGRYRVARPAVFFRDSGNMPEELALRITAPLVETGTSKQVTAEIQELAKHKEKSIRQEFRASGRRFLGRRAIWDQSHEDSPKTSAPHRLLSPTVASRNKWRRIEFLQRCKQFLADYAQSFQNWRNNRRETVFPFGTYAMRIWHGARIAEA